jgi:hypothetical protein
MPVTSHYTTTTMFLTSLFIALAAVFYRLYTSDPGTFFLLFIFLGCAAYAPSAAPTQACPPNTACRPMSSGLLALGVGGSHRRARSPSSSLPPHPHHTPTGFEDNHGELGKVRGARVVEVAQAANRKRAAESLADGGAWDVESGALLDGPGSVGCVAWCAGRGTRWQRCRVRAALHTHTARRTTHKHALL